MVTAFIRDRFTIFFYSTLFLLRKLVYSEPLELRKESGEAKIIFDSDLADTREFVMSAVKICCMQ